MFLTRRDFDNNGNSNSNDNQPILGESSVSIIVSVLIMVCIFSKVYYFIYKKYFRNITTSSTTRFRGNWLNLYKTNNNNSGNDASSIEYANSVDTVELYNNNNRSQLSFISGQSESSYESLPRYSRYQNIPITVTPPPTAHLEEDQPPSYY